VNEVRADDDEGQHTTSPSRADPAPGGRRPDRHARHPRASAVGRERERHDARPSPTSRSLRASAGSTTARTRASTGCAVLTAVAAGELANDRLQSWFKLQRELRAIAIRHDHLLRKGRDAQVEAHREGGEGAGRAAASTAVRPGDAGCRPGTTRRWLMGGPTQSDSQPATAISTPDSLVRRLGNSPVTPFLGGGAAVLLQVAHPLIARALSSTLGTTATSGGGCSGRFVRSISLRSATGRRRTQRRRSSRPCTSGFTAGPRRNSARSQRERPTTRRILH